MDREVDATSAWRWGWTREPSTAVRSTGAIRDGRARLTCIRRIDSGHCARRPMAMLCRLLLVLLHRGICRRCPRRTTTCERREGRTWRRCGPTFPCKRAPGDGASEWTKTSAEQRPLVGVRAPVCNDCAGRGRASTAGLQHAPPSGSVDAVERVTCGLRIEGLAVAAACAFFPDGACRCLIGCLHHRRAHGLLVPADHTRRGAR